VIEDSSTVLRKSATVSLLRTVSKRKSKVLPEPDGP